MKGVTCRLARNKTNFDDFFAGFRLRLLYLLINPEVYYYSYDRERYLGLLEYREFPRIFLESLKVKHFVKR